MKTFVFLAVLVVLASTACERPDGALFDGKRLSSKTERGEVTVVLPAASPKEHAEQESKVALDRLLDVARAEIPLYTAHPGDWEFLMLTRHRMSANDEFYVFQFSPKGRYGDWIQVAVSARGSVLARPKNSAR